MTDEQLDEYVEKFFAVGPEQKHLKLIWTGDEKALKRFLKRFEDGA